MSQFCEEEYTIYCEREVTARKAHVCAACKELIQPGHRYWRVSCVYDQTAETIKRCRRCQVLHVHLRDLCGDSDDGGLWPDERLACGMDYVEEWGELPTEIAALAFALPGEPIP